MPSLPRPRFSVPPFRALSLFIALSLLLAGCAQNTVRLVYSDETGAIPPAGAPQVTVVQLTDERGKADIGVRKDGSAFTPSSNVSEWLSHALAAELSRQGLVVTLAPSEAKARSTGAKYVVVGSIKELWLTEKSTTSYSCDLRTFIQLKDNTATPLINSAFSRSLTREVVPLSSVPQEMLSEIAANLVQPLAKEIRAKIRP